MCCESEFVYQNIVPTFLSFASLFRFLLLLWFLREEREAGSWMGEGLQEKRKGEGPRGYV